MEKKLVFLKILSVLGTILVWAVIVIPIFFSIIALISRGIFRFDYLMPLELFPAFLIGAGLLLFAAIWGRIRIKEIAWSLGIMLGSLLIGQLLAVVTGLASGANEPVGWRGALFVIILVIPILAIIATGVVGVLLVRDLFKRTANLG